MTLKSDPYKTDIETIVKWVPYHLTRAILAHILEILDEGHSMSFGRAPMSIIEDLTWVYLDALSRFGVYI